MSYGWFLDGIDYSQFTKSFLDSISYAAGETVSRTYSSPEVVPPTGFYYYSAFTLPQADIIDTAIPRGPTVNFSAGAPGTVVLTASGGNCACVILVFIE